MAGMRDIKRRIRSVQSTKKITRAMQLVSAAKMRKAQTAVQASRTYSSLAWELISSLGQTVTLDLPLLKVYPAAPKVGAVVISTNRGLVGSLNSGLVPKLKELKGQNPEVLLELTVLGKKAAQLGGRLRYNIVADFPKSDRWIQAHEVTPIVKHITDSYLTGQYRKVVLVYNHFHSTLVQTPTVRTLLPFSGQLVHQSREGATGTEEGPYLFEPNPLAVLEHLLPRIVESQLYQAILESDASEHSARMVMMKNATEAASDLIADLTLTYNQLRQGKITTELAEITAGKIALE